MTANELDTLVHFGVIGLIFLAMMAVSLYRTSFKFGLVYVIWLLIGVAVGVLGYGLYIRISIELLQPSSMSDAMLRQILFLYVFLITNKKALFQVLNYFTTLPR